MSFTKSNSIATKIAIGAIGVAFVFGLLFATAVPAQAALTQSQVDAIISLLQSFGADATTVANVQASLTGGTPTVPGGSTASVCPYTWAVSLTNGSTGADVIALQQFLNSDPATQLGTSGAGSPGNETSFFGSITRAGVVKFQDKYASEVLAPVGLSAGTGYFGSSSRAKANSLCSVATTPPTTTPPGTTPPATGTGLSVFGGVQPAATLAPDSAARVPFTNFIVTAGSDGDVVMDSVTVERTGLAADAAFSGIVLLDEDGLLLGIAKTLNSNHQAKIGEKVTIPAGTSKKFTIAGNMAANNATRDGGTPRLDVVAINTSATVTGSLPIVGTMHTINASLAIGTATVNRGVDDPNANATKEIGTTNYKFAAIRVTAGSAEKIRIRSIRWNQTGSASELTDLNNVKVTVDGTDYGITVSTDGKYYTAIFGNGIVVDKGLQKQIIISGDIIDGSNRTVVFDINKSTDLYVTGETFGYGITASAGTTATGVTTSSQFTTGTPWYDNANVTISAGSVSTVSKSNTVPAQNISINVANQPLGAFEIDIKGEPISVAETIFYFLAVGDAVDDITNITLTDQNGAVLAGPVDGAITSGQAGTATFSDTVTYPTGQTILTLKGQINTDFVNDDTIQASTTPSTDWSTITGQVTGDTISLSTLSTVISANTMTVKAATTTVTMSATPAAQNVVAGVKAFTFANYQFDATESGEDVRVTSSALEYTEGAAATQPTNCIAWDGSTRLNSTVINPSGTGADTYTFDTPLIIPKGTIKTVALKCDIPASATAGNNITFGIAEDNTMEGVGLGSGSTITLTHGTSNGGAMTVQSGGTLTVEKDPSSKSYTLASAGSTGVELGVLLLKATNENIKLNRIGIQLTSATASSSASDFTSITLWDGATQVGSGNFTGTNTIATTTLTSNFIIPKDGEKKLTVKGTLSAIGTGQAGTAGTLLQVDYDGTRTSATEGTGQSSGTSIKSSSASDTAVAGVRMNRSFPTFAKLTPGATKMTAGEISIYRFSVTADSAGPIGIGKITVRVATSSATAGTNISGVNIYGYTNSALTTPVSGIGDSGEFRQSNADLTADWGSASSDIAIYPQTTGSASTTVQVPAGTTYYFDVVGNVANLAGTTYSVSTQIQGDASYPVLLALMSSTTATTAQTALDGGTLNDDFFWSPNSTTTSVVTVDDWTNGYGVPGLRGTNMTAEVLTQ